MKVKYLLLSILVGVFLSSAISKDNKLEVGSNAPKIETIEGINVVNDMNSKDKTKLISFWSPKKPASRIANRELSRKYGEDKLEEVEFISICIDSDEVLMNEVMKLDGINPRNTYSYSQIASRVFKDYGADVDPRAFIISPDGKITDIL